MSASVTHIRTRETHICVWETHVCVRETNLSAQLFFRNVGFRATTVLKDFYDDTTEDAYLMSYEYGVKDSEPFTPVNRITRLAG